MSRTGFILPLLLLALFCYCLSYGEAASIHRHRRTPKLTCGYEACPVVDPKKLNIHLIAHTHDDVGWLKTVDQYFFGSRSNIQKAGVEYIIDSVVQALLADPERKFIYVETAFLWKWWLRQDEKTRETFKSLIDEGRLEIIGGAWSMNDEATTHYHSIVDQFTWGFRRLNDTFGSCARPHVGWQIDPFGHSREQASLFAQMGFDGMFFNRMDYHDQNKRKSEKTMEFIWQGSPSLGKSADIFTVALHNHYNPPPGFCFDVLCNDEPIVDDRDSPDYNVNQRVNDFLSYAENEAKTYRTNNIVVTMGDDFHFQHAEMWFSNLDRLIRYVKELKGSEVNIFYSTPSCYLKALHDLNLSWSTKTDDFFPYANDPHSYWTGYYSSRPSIKFYERMGNNLLQISKQLSALTDLQNYDKQLEHFRETMGVMQHHDAVTGTEKQLVADDYARLIYQSMDNGANIVSDAISKWSTEGEELAQTSQKMYSCMQLNISSCSHTEETKSFVLTVYNPLSQEVSTYVRVPVKGNSYVVTSLADGSQIVSQVVPIPQVVKNIPGRASEAANEIVFRAVVPPLGYSAYTVVEKEAENVEPTVTETSIGSEYYDVVVNDEGQVVVNYNKQDMNVVQSFHYYEGTEGDNKVAEARSSGAYIFRPKQVSTINFAYTGSYTLHKGPVVEEIHQVINDWISQIVRVYKQEDYIEFDWLVGPIPVEDNIGKEIVTKYTSNLKTNEEFYTDANGREMLKRKKNYRPTWNVELEEPVAGNYYPVTSKISIKDQEKSLKLNVLIDRAQGGTSMREGEIELMLHRRLLKDDAFGVGEALNESAFGKGLVVRGTHYLFGGSTKNVDAFVQREKDLALQLALRPWTLVAPVTSDSLAEWRNTHKLQKSGLAKQLPPNIHILTLEPWKDGMILLRLEHLFEVGETMQLSQPVEINIKDLFTTFTVVSVKETTLGGNQWLEEMNRMQWESESNEVLREHEGNVRPVEADGDVINVLMKPMEIRTFIVKVTSRKF